MSTVMGAESRQEAVRKCIREFNSKGIPAFVDAAGREWSPEAYINMDIRTTVSNTANAAQDARCDDYGIDLIAVSSHPGARPKCAKDQGKVYSRSNKSGIAHDGNGKEIHYEPLSSTSYGEPDGLFGINCRHKKYPFIDGVNFQRYFPYDKEENDKRYKEIQEQRRLERKARNTKREADMLNEIGDTEGAKAARAKLKEQQKAYRTCCDEHELTQRNDRLTVSKTSSGSRSNAGTSAGNAPKASFAKAAEVNVPAPASSGKAYTGEKIVKPLDVNNYFEAKTIDEAQAYAKSIGVKYPDYSKFTLERANNMNMAISTLPDDSKPYAVTDLQKYTAVTGAPLDKRAKNGYACTVTPYEINLKRAGIADVPSLSGSGNTIVAVNTKTYKTIDSITESKAKSEELVVSSGRGKAYHFNTDGKATDFHECGHVYASKHGLPMAFSSDADRWYRETGCLLLQSPNEAWSEAYAAYYTHADDLPPYIRRYFDPGEWKTGSGSKVLSLDEWHTKVVDNSNRSGIINTGAISGALNPYSKEAAKHATQYYESVRHMKTDVSKISAATGISQDKIDKIKNHVFIAEHDLLTSRERFAPSYDMAQSWQRLINGDYKEQDIVLLKHEYAELRYMEKGYTQNEAHILASKKYNYAKYCE